MHVKFIMGEKLVLYINAVAMPHSNSKAVQKNYAE